MNHLANIERRHRTSRVRDFAFAAFVALATLISVSTVSTAAHAAGTTHVATR